MLKYLYRQDDHAYSRNYVLVLIWFYKHIDRHSKGLICKPKTENQSKLQAREPFSQADYKHGCQGKFACDQNSHYSIIQLQDLYITIFFRILERQCKKHNAHVSLYKSCDHTKTCNYVFTILNIFESASKNKIHTSNCKENRLHVRKVEILIYQFLIIYLLFIESRCQQLICHSKLA